MNKYKLVCEHPDSLGYGMPDSGCGELTHIIFEYWPSTRPLPDGVCQDGITWEKFSLSNDGVVTPCKHWNEDVNFVAKYAEKLDIGHCPKCGNTVPVVTEKEFESVCRRPKL